MRDNVLAYKTRFDQFLWRSDTTTLPVWTAHLVVAVRIVHGVIQDVAGGQVTLRAMSLVYTTLLSFVPLLAISFSVLKGFGVHNQIEPFLIGFLAPLGERAAEVTEQVISFVDNTKVGVLGAVGFGLLFYTVVSLMQKIESAFNYVWRIDQPRTLAQRVRDYLSIVVIGPVLIFTALGVMATLVSAPGVAQLSAIEPFGWLIKLISRLVPALMVIAAFTFIYMFMPNTAVRFRSALLGGVIAGLLWNATGWLFAVFVATSTKYTSIYSGFATPIVFMVWLYLAWLILLVGASIAFYHQHPDYGVLARRSHALSNRQNEFLALVVIAAIARDFYGGEPPAGADRLSHILKAPIQAVTNVLGILQSAGFVMATADEAEGYLPARPFDVLTVREVYNAVREAGGSDSFPSEDGFPATNQLFDHLAQTTNDALDGLTVKDFALQG